MSVAPVDGNSRRVKLCCVSVTFTSMVLYLRNLSGCGGMEMAVVSADIADLQYNGLLFAGKTGSDRDTPLGECRSACQSRA